MLQAFLRPRLPRLLSPQLRSPHSDMFSLSRPYTRLDRYPAHRWSSHRRNPSWYLLRFGRQSFSFDFPLSIYLRILSANLCLVYLYKFNNTLNLTRQIFYVYLKIICSFFSLFFFLFYFSF